jgi:hypothetical protein
MSTCASPNHGIISVALHVIERASVRLKRVVTNGHLIVIVTSNNHNCKQPQINSGCNISKAFRIERNTWISDKDLFLFVERAGTLFMYASAYLTCTWVKDTIEHVQSLLIEVANSIDSSKENPTAILDNL